MIILQKVKRHIFFTFSPLKIFETSEMTPCFGRASFLLKSVGIWNIMEVGFDVRG